MIPAMSWTIQSSRFLRRPDLSAEDCALPSDSNPVPSSEKRRHRRQDFRRPCIRSLSVVRNKPTLVRNDVRDDCIARGEVQSERIATLRLTRGATRSMPFALSLVISKEALCSGSPSTAPSSSDLIQRGGGAVLAADKTPSPPCKPLANLWADFDAKTHFTALTPGQFHFVEGLYVGSPTTPEGLPP